MGYIEQICQELQRADDSTSKVIASLERERNGINMLMDRVQRAFGDTREGQALVLTLNTAMKFLVDADSSLYQLQSLIKQNIGRIRN